MAKIERKCPECGEMNVVICITLERSGLVVKMTELSPPPFCPMCGHPWWRDELGKEAYKITEDS